MVVFDICSRKRSPSLFPVSKMLSIFSQVTSDAVRERILIMDSIMGYSGIVLHMKHWAAVFTSG